MSGTYQVMLIDHFADGSGAWIDVGVYAPDVDPRAQFPMPPVQKLDPSGRPLWLDDQGHETTTVTGTPATTDGGMAAQAPLFTFSEKPIGGVDDLGTKGMTPAEQVATIAGRVRVRALARADDVAFMLEQLKAARSIYEQYKGVVFQSAVVSS